MAKKTSPIRESRKIELQYRKSLLVRANWLEEHQNQIIRELKSNASNFENDASGTDLIAKINSLREDYRKRFPALMTQKLAKTYYDRLNSYNSSKMNSAFNALGIDLKEALKKEKLEDFTNIAIKNQVDLITSIPDEYFAKVEKIVLNGMQAGTNYEDLGKKIQEVTGATKKRAKLIAKDQTTTINAQLSKKRATAAGITKGEWVKTKFSKTSNYNPRKSHIEADGKTFDLDKGLLVDGEYVIPGEPINCSCSLAFVVD